MAKKNIKISALKFEISTNLDRTLEILEKLELVECSDVWFESRAENWVYGNPSEKEMDKVLKALGY